MSKKIHSHNSKFFNNVSLLTSYWAGFLAADGSIDLTNNSVRLRLSNTDMEHVKKFSSDVSYTGKLTFSPKTNSGGVQLYSAHEMMRSLKDTFNITPNKSLTLQPPNLESYHDDIIKSYIIGYIDGDGCIKYVKRDDCLVLDIFSGSKPFIEWIKQKIEKWYPFIERPIYSYKNGHTYRLNGKVANKVLVDLLKIDIPRLTRKWNKVIDFNKIKL